MARIVSTHVLHPTALALLEGVGVVTVATGLDAETLRHQCRDADALIVRAPLPGALFAEAPRLRLAARHGSGLDMIPMPEATAAGVLVSNVPGANARSVAEHAMLLMLMLVRRLPAVRRALEAGDWHGARREAESGSELAGKRLGIVGFGHIGRSLAGMAHHGFGLEILSHTPRPVTLPPWATGLDLDTLMAESDIVVLCCPLTPATRGMIDRRRIGLMRPNAVIINVSRGAVIEDVALIAALREKRIAGAGLDVFATQPLGADHPYFGLDTVVVTPHMAAISTDSMEAMGVGAAEEVVRVLGGGLPKNLCNPEALARYRQRFG